MLRVKNTALEPSKSLLIRQAPKLDMEPLLEGGKRLRLRTKMDISEEWAQKNRKVLEDLIKSGVIEIEGAAPYREPTLNDKGEKLGGPTLEEFIKAGYSAETYPPLGWAEVPSAGLTAFRKEQDDKKALEEAEKLTAEIKAKEEAELRYLLEEEAKAKAAAEAAAKIETAELPVISDALTTSVEPAGAPITEVAPPAAPAVSEEKTEAKKGSGKSKLK